MPLNVDITRCKDFEKLLVDGEIDELTKGLSFMNMVAGVPEITEKSVDKLYERLCLLARLDGPPLTGNQFFTREDIVRRIGMRCNVSPRTKADFWKGIRRSLEGEAVRWVENRIKKEEAA